MAKEKPSEQEKPQRLSDHKRLRTVSRLQKFGQDMLRPYRETYLYFCYRHYELTGTWPDPEADIMEAMEEGWEIE